MNLILLLPPPSIFTFGILPPALRIRPAANKLLGDTVSPFLNFFSIFCIFTAAGSGRNALNECLPRPLNLGIFFRISRSIGKNLAPARACCPLVPRPEYVPRFPPRPILRPLRRLVLDEILCICILLLIAVFTALLKKTFGELNL